MKTIGKVAAILLASGFSERFGGRNKLMVPFRNKPLARYTLELAADASGALKFEGGIFFVCASDEVAALAKDFPAVTVIKNKAPEKDLRESVRLGIMAAEADCEYYIFFHCDEPLLDAATVERILDARKPGFIVEPRYRQRPGNPSLFSAAFRDELLSLKEEESPKLIKARYPEAVIQVAVTDPLVLEDIDDEETLEWLER